MLLKKQIVSGCSKTENQEIKPAFFLDRDGVINIDHGYVHKPDDLEFLEHVGPVLKKISERYHIIVVTNQSGIARNYFDIDSVFSFHEFLNKKLKDNFDVQINAFYICPHHPKFSEICTCRKPATGLLDEAMNDFKILKAGSVMVGDKESDIICANNFGIRSIQLSGNYPISQDANHICKNWYELEDLLGVMKLI